MSEFLAPRKRCICCDGMMKLKKRRGVIEFYWKCFEPGGCGCETRDAQSAQAEKAERIAQNVMRTARGEH